MFHWQNFILELCHAIWAMHGMYSAYVCWNGKIAKQFAKQIVKITASMTQTLILTLTFILNLTLTLT